MMKTTESSASEAIVAVVSLVAVAGALWLERSGATIDTPVPLLCLVWALVVLNVFSISRYVNARIEDNKALVRVWQPVTVIISWLIASLSLLAPNTDTALTWVLLVGMGVAIVGDFVNIDMEDMAVVLRALVIASVAYLVYAIGFCWLEDWRWYGLPDACVAVILTLGYLYLLRLLWPHLQSGKHKNMKVPVVIYAAILPFTVWRASSTVWGDRFCREQALLLVLGTLGLYVADIEYGVYLITGQSLHGRRMTAHEQHALGSFLYSSGELCLALAPWVNCATAAAGAAGATPAHSAIVNEL